MVYSKVAFEVRIALVCRYKPTQSITNEQQNGMCAQWRLKSAWASAQSGQSLRCPHEETLGPQLRTERTAMTLVGWLCWGLTSQSTIFQSCRDGAIASWVINQYFRGVKCLAQGHNTAAVGLEPRTSRSGVRHSTTEPPRSPAMTLIRLTWAFAVHKVICWFSREAAHFSHIMSLLPNSQDFWQIWNEYFVNNLCLFSY